MKVLTLWRLALLFSLSIITYQGAAQEALAPVTRRPQLEHAMRQVVNTANKGASLTLPFFEDFTDYSQYPNPARWIDSQAYVNNTMPVQPIARGVATLDALNSKGRPYDTLNPFASRYGDSLTSQPLDLSGNSPGDSIYFSFFYQPQGNGFSPDPGDSLMLFFHRKTGGWQKVWSVDGVSLQSFRQVMVPVRDTQFFAADFQFRFVNIISINSNDDVWNVDYIRIAVNRNLNDTAVNDLAFTTNPTFLLNDYTYMPYRQYAANAAAERGVSFSDSIANHYATPATVNYGFTAREVTGGTPLGSGTNTGNFPAYSMNGISFPTYSTLPSASASGKMIFENKFYLQSGSPVEPKGNDTIVQNQIFDNYLAYDDGTAEKSYYLNLFPTLPGKLALEYHLHAPDTLRGLAIYFGQQVPAASYKLFSIVVYNSILGINNAPADVEIYREDDDQVVYTDSINGFTVYRFSHPVVVPAGVFYVGITQPANSGSDSLYIGYDANRIGGNHLYFNVLNSWQSSIVGGALMIRPLLGGPISGTGIANVYTAGHHWSLFPNPAQNSIRILEENDGENPRNYEISDAVGRLVISGRTSGSDPIDIHNLLPGLYIVSLKRFGMPVGAPQKFIKQ